MSRVPVLVLGLGNVLLGDEGVGVHVVQAIAADRPPLPAGTQVVDGGTLGLELLPVVSDADALILVDAADLGQEPGAVNVVSGDSLRARLAGHVSPHQAGAGDLIAAARLMGVLPGRMAMVGIQPGSLEPAVTLSQPVEAAVPRAVGIVCELAREMVELRAHA